MINLDDINTIQRIDKDNLKLSIEDFSKQILFTLKEFKNIELSGITEGIDNIVFSGMGGSSLGARIAKSLLLDHLDIPMDIINGYELPGYVGPNTLVIISSYSGGTEETVSCYEKAVKANAKVFVITSGGKIKELAEERNDKAFIFDGVSNPSGSPRLGLGYMFTSVYLLLSYFSSREEEIDVDSLVASISSLNEHFGVNVPEVVNKAKQLSRMYLNKEIAIVASEFLTGAGYTVKNQLNENAKTYANFFDIPELNHHLMEGLAFPKANKMELKFLFIESDEYMDRIKKRYGITKDVLLKNNISFETYTPQSKTKLLQAYEIIVFGYYFSYYLSILNETDPHPIPWVDYFKERMK